MKDRMIQLLIAAILSIGGLALLYLGAIYAPQGQIHETILVAFGEVATFAGSIIGIDYHYRTKKYDNSDTNPRPPNEGQGGDRTTIRPLQ